MEVHVQTSGQSAAATAGTRSRAAAHSELQSLDGWWNARRRRPEKIANAAVLTCLRSVPRSEEHTSELQSRGHLVCRLLLEKKKRARSKATSKFLYDTNSTH